MPIAQNFPLNADGFSIGLFSLGVSSTADKDGSQPHPGDGHIRMFAPKELAPHFEGLPQLRLAFFKFSNRAIDSPQGAAQLGLDFWLVAQVLTDALGGLLQNIW